MSAHSPAGRDKEQLQVVDRIFVSSSMRSEIRQRTPDACASIRVIGNPSHLDGMTNRSRLFVQGGGILLHTGQGGEKTGDPHLFRPFLDSLLFGAFACDNQMGVYPPRPQLMQDIN